MRPAIALYLVPLVVLYVVIDVVSRGGVTSEAGAALGVAGVLLSLVPWWTKGVRGPGALRVRALAWSAGFLVVRFADERTVSTAAGLSGALAATLGAILVVDLALSVPKLERSSAKFSFARWVVVCVGLVAAAVGLRMGTTDLHWQLELLVGASVLALIIRGYRLRSERAPEAHAQHLWAGLGVGLAIPCLIGSLLQSGATARSYVVASLGLAALTVAHVVLGRVERRLQAGVVARRSLDWVVALGATAGVLVATREVLAIAIHPVALVATALGGTLLCYGVVRWVGPQVDRWFGPFGARLLVATAEGRADLHRVSTLEGLARAVLRPLRRASADLEAEPVLFTSVPAQELRIDAAGEPRRRHMAMPEPIRHRLLDRPGEIIVRDAIEQVIVRRPELRALFEILGQLDALCVLPLFSEAELEGCLVLPRGKRKTPIRAEEMAALETLSAEVASVLTLLGAAARADERAQVAEAARAQVEAELDRTQELLEARTHELKVALRTDRAGRNLVAYSPAMRTALERLKVEATNELPVTLVSEVSSGVLDCARFLHDMSGRSGGPFIVADLAGTRREDLAAALLGSREAPVRAGWLELARGGTLVLKDAPALSPELQIELVTAYTERRAMTAGSKPEAYDVDVRLVLASRVELFSLENGTEAHDSALLHDELGRWASRSVIIVPPLRDRREDLASLLFLSIDAACRALGREPVGVDADVLEALLAHAWPGNLAELDALMERSVRSASGPRISLADVPPLWTAADARAEDPLAGTYDDLEQRILLRALDRASGNKSEAARLLGLKRTTFLDKLRRFGFEDPKTVSA